MSREFFPGQNAVVVNITFVGNAFADNPVKVRDYHVALCVFHGPDKKFRGIRGNPVVTVQKLQVCSAGMADRGVSCV